MRPSSSATVPDPVFQRAPRAPPVLDPRLTEQRNPRSADLDTHAPLEWVRLVQAEDRRAVEAVAAEAEAIARGVELFAETLASGGRVFYVGAGTSGRLGVLDAAEMPPTFGTPPDWIQGIIAGGVDALVRAQEGAEDRGEGGAHAVEAQGVRAGDFVLGIAASGTTPFVHGALDRARSLGARTGFLLCTPPEAALRARHDLVIAPLVGPEVITGSTRMKAGTATKLVLNTLSSGAMVQLGKVWGNLMVDLQVTCQKLQDRGERILRTTLGVSATEAASLLQEADGEVKTALVLGRMGGTAAEARARLHAVGGRVGALLGPPPPP
jgi:N-acetylmuramic acid 6-phosphate etherase